MRSSRAPSRGRPRPAGADLWSATIHATTPRIGKVLTVVAGPPRAALRERLITQLRVVLIRRTRLPFAPQLSGPSPGASWFRYVRAAVAHPSHPPAQPPGGCRSRGPPDGRLPRPAPKRGISRARRNRDGEPTAVPGPRRRLGGRVGLPSVVAGEVVAAHPALRGAVLPVGGLRRGRRDRVLRDPVHRALSEVTVRLQRRRAALELAGALLRLLGAGHRPLSAVHPRRRAGLPGAPGRGLPRAALPRAGAGEVVAAGHPTPADRVAVHRRRAVGREPGDLGQRLGQRLGSRRRPGLAATPLLRDRAAVHRPVPA